MSILEEPTPLQRRVLETAGDLLVVGVPGTGKTTVALAKAEAFIEQTQLEDYQSVLFLSFSNAAVHRIREAARGGISRYALRRIETTTFHGLCYSILASHRRLVGLQKPFSLLPPEDEASLRSRLEEPDRSAEFRRLEVEEGKVRFDRFSTLTITLFDGQPLIAAAYGQAFPLVIVDEYQDTSDEQDEVVQLLTRGGQVIYLGDPDQRIYDYVPGTRPDRLDRTGRRAGVETIRLEVNHRSGGTDIAQLGRAVLRGERQVARPTCVHVRGFGNTRTSQVDVLKREIVRLEEFLARRLPAGTPKSIAIMARTNAHVQGLSSALLETNDRWQYPFRHQVLLSPEAVAIAWDAVMVIVEARMTTDQRTAEVLRSAARLNRLKVDVESRIRQAERLERWADDVDRGHLSGRAAAAHELRRRVDEFTASVTGDPASDCRAAREVLRGLPGDYLDQLTSVLDLRLPAGGIGDLSGALAESYLDRGAYQNARAISEAALLKERMELGSYSRAPRVLMTMHKCKGKQFHAVIIVDAHHRPHRLLEGDVHESRRLLHVAITRASTRTVILTPTYRPCPILPRFV